MSHSLAAHWGIFSLLSLLIENLGDRIMELRLRKGFAQEPVRPRSQGRVFRRGIDTRDHNDLDLRVLQLDEPDKIDPQSVREAVVQQDERRLLFLEEFAGIA